MGKGSCDSNVTAATNNTHNPAKTAWSCFSGEAKKEADDKPRTKGREVSCGTIGFTTEAVTQDLLSGIALVLKLEQSIT